MLYYCFCCMSYAATFYHALSHYITDITLYTRSITLYYTLLHSNSITDNISPITTFYHTLPHYITDNIPPPLPYSTALHHRQNSPPFVAAQPKCPNLRGTFRWRYRTVSSGGGNTSICLCLKLRTNHMIGYV